jgi:hypothetical protein
LSRVVTSIVSLAMALDYLETPQKLKKANSREVVKPV